MSTGDGCSDHVKKLIAEDGGGMETPLIDPVRIATGAAAGAIVRQIGKTAVYTAVEDGVVKYVGITDNLLARAAAHLREKGITIEAIPGLTNLPRLDARGVEQVLIERFGLGKDGGSLLNKINSISSGNSAYNSAVARGRELLNPVGF